MEVRAIADSIARWALVALIALMPFFVIPASWATVIQSKLLLAAILVAIAIVFYCIARIAQGVFLIPRDAILYAALLLPVAYFVSAFVSGSAADSYASGLGLQDTVASITILCATLALAAILFAGGMRTVLFVFLAFLGGCSLVILFQAARLFAPLWLTLGGAVSGSASSIFGAWHDLGVLAALLIFFAIAFFDSPFLGRRISRIALPIIGLLSYVLTFVIALPDIWYGLAALLLLFALYAGYMTGHGDALSRRTSARQAVAAFIVGILSLIAGFAGHYVYTYLPQPLRITQTEVRPSWQGTFVVGEKVFVDNGSLFGTGPNTFQNAWGKWKPPGVNETVFWSTDFNQGVGFVPTSFVTAGVLGILAWLALLLSVIFHLVRFVRNHDQHDRSLHASLLGGILFLLGFHIVYTPTLAVSLILFFLLGLAVAITTLDRQHTFVLPLSFRSIGGLLSLVLVLLLGASVVLASALAVRAASSDIIIQKAAADYQATADVARALTSVQTALVMNPANDRAHRAAVELGLLQLQKLISAGNNADAEALKETLSATIASGLSAVSIDSADYQNWLSLASAYQNLANVGVEGAYENAIAAYEKAAAANPTNPLPLIGAGQVALAQGKVAASVDYLNAAILLKTNLAVAYFLRSQAEGQLNNFPSAIEDAKIAASLAREDPLAWYNLGVILYASGDYRAAAQALSQAVSLSNDYSNALFVLALAFNQQGDHARAIAAMQRVVELNPNNDTASSTLASLLAESSQNTNAR